MLKNTEKVTLPSLAAISATLSSGQNETAEFAEVINLPVDEAAELEIVHSAATVEAPIDDIIADDETELLETAVSEEMATKKFEQDKVHFSIINNSKINTIEHGQSSIVPPIENAKPTPETLTQWPGHQHPQRQQPETTSALRNPVELALISQQASPAVTKQFVNGSKRVSISNSVSSQKLSLEMVPQGAQSSRLERQKIQSELLVSETPKPTAQAMATSPAAALGLSKVVDPKSMTEGSKDVSEIRFDSLLEAKQVPQTAQSSPINRPELAAPVTRQVVDAIKARISSEKVIEVSLNPAELGRLKLSITPAENGLVVTILADRSEAIELMRRNLIDLEQAFSEMGHENISFTFEQNDSATNQDQNDHSDASLTPVNWSDEVITTTIQQTQDATVSSGVDIRI